MHVLATAGHVDHGKSTLVRALTGMEPDRWVEERRRGMTIDLGYAWTTLRTGEELAFVDVPGHERFIGNMLAGLGPAPGVLFVVAADEGWSRQSDEHLAAIDALDLQHGVLAVTRSDLADPTRAVEESLDHIRRSSLADVTYVTVSGVTGAGLDDLRDELAALVGTLPTPDPDARVRLWVDRSFTIRGSGTVATGTLSAGSIGVGDELVLGDRRVSVRGVQSLGEQRDRVSATARVALNLRGVPTSAISRGAVLLSPGRWHRTDVVDVQLDRADRLPAGLILHVGTASLPVRIRPLGDQAARLTLPHAVPLLAGDRGVLRDPSRHAVAAGVLVLDADPPPLARRGAARHRAAQLEHGRPTVRDEIARRGAVQRDHLTALGIVTDVPDIDGWLIAPDAWHRWVAAAPATVAEWVRRNPIEIGMPVGTLRHALGVPDEALLPRLLADAGLRAADGRVDSAPRATLGPAEAAVCAIEDQLHARPFDAPERAQLAELRLGARELAAAERAGRLLRIADELVLLPDAPELAVQRLRALPQPFTISQARQALDTTRRVAVPLLEHLDRRGATERVDAQLRRVL